MRKHMFLEPQKRFLFAKPGLSEFHKSSAEKTIFQVAFFFGSAWLDPFNPREKG